MTIWQKAVSHDTVFIETNKPTPHRSRNLLGYIFMIIFDNIKPRDEIGIK